jgi:hypothetical protein
MGINILIIHPNFIFSNWGKYKLVPKLSQLGFFPSKSEQGGLVPAALGYFVISL